ncbi:MAG: hypothetical protein AAGA03_06900 [Planctomycetota bacterium]
MVDGADERDALREPLLPQLSIRFMAGLIAIAAVFMLAARFAFVDGSRLAQCLVAVILIGLACFLAYAGLFVIASIFNQVFALKEPTPRPPRAFPAGLKAADVDASLESTKDADTIDDESPIDESNEQRVPGEQHVPGEQRETES